ncbi:hypothetical protein CGRA01v4_02806 [Colletotrichum graminicola]|uniref:DUF7053 domain-containing protein n=1 Tax=Colletotrichum graminicola (strain M1.001 / M2 / FGSC 10212) TaxID=645133 RepID=E3QA92_COLGM|nr:uncharacterized protein GLRG_02924 [Colletotrichum graminicola M1.001]EFQ27780.1 hypothetical protein GLRG_02924 [Colletotrichum graminicola M1.001]WDK11527.1 hypothetical protein CGRA01v4_02806 [Colletotrichum graminicola]
MSKRSTFTTITPLPAGITREAVLSFLHNHLEMIDLNPLIKERHIIPAPAHAPPEEHACVWYSLTDEISYLPGGMVTGDVSYTCCFHDLPTGLQTHCYAPLGLEIRDKWTVAGCLPGEPVEPVELGLGAPQTGLYIREDVDMRCNVFTSSFVKKTLKKSHAQLVDRITSKVRQASAAAHHPHSSQYPPSLPGSANSASDTSPRQSYTDSLASQKTSLPYRPSHSHSTPAPAVDDDTSAAYPEPLRIRHASANSISSRGPPRPDSRSQSGGSNNGNSGGTLQGPFVAELD